LVMERMCHTGTDSAIEKCAKPELFSVAFHVPIWHHENMKLTKYLEREGLSPEQFAARLGVHRTTITRYLNGTRRPNRRQERLLMQVTGGSVTPMDFMDPLSEH
jgi:DNA-binding transcriptional regulator YiaG